MPRNPLISEVLYLSGDIEKWGSGLRRISQECKAVNVKVEFNSIKSGFMVSFHRSDLSGKNISSKNIEGLNEGLNEGLKTLLAQINAYPGIMAKKLSLKLQRRPIKTIERQIKYLTDKGFIERKGSRKTGGYYRIEIL